MTELNSDVLARLNNLTRFFYFKFSVKEPFEDVYHDLVYQIIHYDYLSRFDNTKPLHNYLSGFVYNHFCKLHTREHYKVSQALSLDKELSGTEHYTISDFVQAEERDPDMDMEIEFLAAHLNSYLGFSSFVVYSDSLKYKGAYSIIYYDTLSSDPNNILFERSAAVVFKFLYLGMSQSEIKDILKVSKSWVSKIVKRISEVPEIRKFGASRGFTNET